MSVSPSIEPVAGANAQSIYATYGTTESRALIPTEAKARTATCRPFYFLPPRFRGYVDNEPPPYSSRILITLEQQI